MTNFPRVSNLHTHHTITLVTGMGCGCGLSKKYKWAPIPQRMKFWKSFKQPRLPPLIQTTICWQILNIKLFRFGWGWLLSIFSRNCSVFIEQEAFLERQEPSGRTFPLQQPLQQSVAFEAAVGKPLLAGGSTNLSCKISSVNHQLVFPNLIF